MLLLRSFLVKTRNPPWNSQLDYVTTHSHPSRVVGAYKKYKIQSQKTEGFCVADFATLSDERKSRSKIVLMFNTDIRILRSKI